MSGIRRERKADWSGNWRSLRCFLISQSGCGCRFGEGGFAGTGQLCEGGCADLGVALAAILQKEVHKPGQGGIDCAVDDVAPLPTGLDQSGMFTMSQVEGQPRGRGVVNSFADRPGSHAFRPSLHQQAHNAQSGGFPGICRCRRPRSSFPLEIRSSLVTDSSTEAVHNPSVPSSQSLNSAADSCYTAASLGWLPLGRGNSK